MLLFFFRVFNIHKVKEKSGGVNSKEYSIYFYTTKYMII